jgi:hypothetical protein
MSRARRLTARLTCWFAVLFLVFSAAMKFVPIPAVEQSFAQLGLPPSMRTALGLLESGCTLAYALPRTRVLGAVLLTGYLGGAIVTHWRVGDPWLTHTLFPLWLGVLVWIDPLLRDDALRTRLFGGAARARPA